MTLKIMTLLALAAPLAMVILGLICWRFPPGGPNWILGFRSRRARAGDASWKFAQCWAGRLWFLLGLGWVIAVLLISRKQSTLPIEDSLPVYLNMVGLQLAGLLLVILGMNVALLIRFDRFGRVRTKKERKKEEKASREGLPQDEEYGQLPEYYEDEAEEAPEEGEYPEEAAQYQEEDFGDYDGEDFEDYGEYEEYEDYSEHAEEGPLGDPVEGDTEDTEWI